MSAPLRQTPSGPHEERLFELLLERAVFGLDEAEQRELERLAAQARDVDTECFERAAAALDIAFLEGRCAVMPAEIQQRILAAAPHAGARAGMPRALDVSRVARPARRNNLVLWSGWIAAAAATIVAILAWTSRAERKALAPAEAFAEFVREAPDGMKLVWTPTDDPDGKQVSGELVWSPSEQKGFMRFRGLPKNDARTQEYQLWIFDKKRGMDAPVDGGVFDVDLASGEVIVPIHADLRVFEPSMFAVTEEPPGGVVVSKREHVVALAKL